MVTVPAGSYDVTVTKFVAGTRKTKEGQERLTLYFSFDVQGVELQGKCFIQKNDGSISPADINNIKETFGWDGTAEGLDVHETFVGKQCTIVVEEVAGMKDPNQKYSQVKWINPLGQQGGAAMPEAMPKSEIVAKYGATLRALSPQPVKAPAKPPTAKKSAPPPAKKLDGPVPTMEQCWETCLKACGGDQEKAEAKWTELIAGREYDAINDDGWRDVMKQLGQNLPF